MDVQETKQQESQKLNNSEMIEEKSAKLEQMNITNINLPYYSEDFEAIKNQIDMSSLKQQIGEPDILVKQKKELRLSRTKSIKKVYGMKLLRNKTNPSKFIYQLTLLGETADKYDFIDYKDIFFQPPITTEEIVESFQGTCQLLLFFTEFHRII